MHAVRMTNKIVINVNEYVCSYIDRLATMRFTSKIINFIMCIHYNYLSRLTIVSHKAKKEQHTTYEQQYK